MANKPTNSDVEVEISKSQSVRIHSVHIDGIEKTKDSFIKQQLKDLLQVKDFITLLKQCGETRRRLLGLGIFKSVDCIIDSADEQIPGERLLKIHFQVNEKRRIHATTRVTCGMENTMQFDAIGNVTNLFGRAINCELDYQRGMGKGTRKSLGVNASFPLIATKPWIRGGFGVWQYDALHRWACFNENSRGIYGELLFPSPIGQHQLRLEGQWRSIRASDCFSPIAIRECSGDYLKPCLRHTWQRDTRDNPIFPQEGTYFRSITEVSGNPLYALATIGPPPGPTTLCHIKQEWQANVNLPLLNWLFTPEFVENWGLAIEMTLGIGLASTLSTLSSTSSSNSLRIIHNSLNIADRFFVGGPFSLRGFEMKSLGPQTMSTGPIASRDAGAFAAGRDGGGGSSRDGAGDLPPLPQTTPPPPPPPTAAAITHPTAALGSEAYFISGLHFYSALPYFGRQHTLTDALRLHGFVNVGNAQSIVKSPFCPDWWKESRLSTGFGLILKLSGIARIELHYCIPLRALPGDKTVNGLQFGFGISYL